MKSRLFFREHGHVINTRGGSRLANAAFTLGAITLLLGALAYGHNVDAQAEAQDLFEAGETELQLALHAKNQPARALYLSLGFTELHRDA